MTTDYADQRRACADDIYNRGGYYMLVEANTDLFGYPIIGGGYRDVRPLTYDEALTIHLAPWQGLRHARGAER